MIWCSKRILGFGLKKKKIRGKREKYGGKYLYFPFILWGVNIFPPNEVGSKVRYLFKINTCQHREKTEFLTRNGSWWCWNQGNCLHKQSAKAWPFTNRFNLICCISHFVNWHVHPFYVLCRNFICDKINIKTNISEHSKHVINFLFLSHIFVLKVFLQNWKDGFTWFGLYGLSPLSWIQKHKIITK